MPQPESCVDWRLKRINTKTKIPLTSQSHKSMDLKSNTNSKPPCHFSQFPPTPYFLNSSCVPVHVDCKSAGSRDCILAKSFSVTSSFMFYFRSCRALLLAVCFFLFFYYDLWHKFTLSSMLLTEPTAARANQNSRSLNVCSCVLLIKNIASGT